MEEKRGEEAGRGEEKPLTASRPPARAITVSEDEVMLGGMTIHPAVGTVGTCTIHQGGRNLDVEVWVKDVRQRWFRTEYHIESTEPIGLGMGKYVETWVNAKRVRPYNTW